MAVNNSQSNRVKARVNGAATPMALGRIVSPAVHGVIFEVAEVRREDLMGVPPQFLVFGFAPSPAPRSSAVSGLEAAGPAPA